MFKDNQLLNKGKYRIIKTLGGGAGQTHLNSVSLAQQGFEILATKLNNG